MMLRHWKQRDLILLFERLELYLRSGLGAHKAIETAGEGLRRRERECLLKMKAHVESGGLVSKAFSTYIGLEESKVGLIAHGESCGRLAEACGALRSLLERQDDLKKKCLSAMAYPVIIGVFALLLTVGLVRGVMPQIIPMLMGLHVPLPLVTRVTIATSNMLLSHGFAVLATGIIIPSAISFLYRRSARFRYILQAFLIKVPLLGGLLSSYSLSLFLRSCGTLVESGVSIGVSYAKSTQTVSIGPLKNMLAMRRQDVEDGMPLHKVCRNIPMPPYVAPLLSAGELSGTLGASMIRAAHILDGDIEHALKRLTSLVEPVLMAGMGTVVGGIALSIMMPIYDISRILQK